MTRKTFTASIVVLAILGVMSLLILYMTLGRLQEAFAAKSGHGTPAASPPSQAAAPADPSASAASDISAQLAAQGIRELSLTPAGRAQMQQLQARQAPGAGTQERQPAPRPGEPGPPAQPAQAAQPGRPR
jgi:hypothetical protein